MIGQIQCQACDKYPEPSFPLISDPDSTPTSPSLRRPKVSSFHSPLRSQTINSRFQCIKGGVSLPMKPQLPGRWQQPLWLSSHNAWGSHTNHNEALLCAHLRCITAKCRQNTTYKAKCQIFITLQVQKEVVNTSSCRLSDMLNAFWETA